jgi:hypothetical protein
MALESLAKDAGMAAAFVFTSWQAFRANRQTKSTGNGFAKHMKEGIDRIEVKLEVVEGKIDRHIEDHAESDLRKN